MQNVRKYYLDGRMDRETTVIKENPRSAYEAVIKLILDFRQRQLPTIPLTCGNQSANIRVVYRRINRFSIFSSTQINSWRYNS
ncbi:MAG: hypothetical protein KAU17_07135 [Spirochaetales bacterium]|nr:hypothetical protein [Spirochaetales bacterium]